MNFRTMLLEVYCLAKEADKAPPYCKWGKERIGIHCITERCPFCGYFGAENELAVSDSRGLALDGSSIGFGGEMDTSCNDEEREILLKKWHDICRKKIDEAYVEYMGECTNKKGD
ncbi:MAG: hypothetical protein K2K57_02530 [Oscillospiraceae bacterium]|nr:hypothetical protein [Oscillospiraceae bacterium]